MRLWQTPGVIYQSQNTEPREVTNGWSTGICTPLHRSLLFKRRGGISRAERGPFLGSFLLSGRREGSAFGQNRPKRLQSGSLEQRPEPPEWPHVSAASVGQWGAELPSAAGWHAHTLHRHASSDAQEGGRANHVLENSTTSLTWVLCFNFIKTICQHRQKVKKVDNEHCGLNTGLHAALSVPSTVHTLTHKHLSPGPFENELQMS